MAAAKAAMTARDTLKTVSKQAIKAQEDLKAAHAAAKIATPKPDPVCESISEYDPSLCVDRKNCKKRHPEFCNTHGPEGCFPKTRLECLKWHLPYPLSQLKKQREEEKKAKRANQSKKPGNTNRNSKLGVSVKGPQGGTSASRGSSRSSGLYGSSSRQRGRQHPPWQPPQLPQQQHPPGSMSWAAVAVAPGLNREQLANMRRPSPPRCRRCC